MYKDFVMQTLGIELAPLLSLCLFVVFFTAVSIRAFTISKAQINELGNIPLDDKNTELHTDFNE
ncbi:MAG: CcoQ/FixQ family Cbb3-type cytochrome c oxidase assembly chaperone [Sphingobacteriales bacterium]|nr:MAG: CcoQ/FixQ family Cbb3-type cytochrome c oxidase assembly chaperone [Sphingobacteriales bacterium]